MSFKGSFEHTIDAKGRVSLPARHRELLAAQSGERLVVTKAPTDPCLWGFPPDAWAAFEERLESLPKGSPQVRMLMRHLVANAHEVQVDASGRILIPPTLRDYAGLERDVVVVGQIRQIELWAKDRWLTMTGEYSSEELDSAWEQYGI